MATTATVARTPGTLATVAHAPAALVAIMLSASPSRNRWTNPPRCELVPGIAQSTTDTTTTTPIVAAATARIRRTVMRTWATSRARIANAGIRARIPPKSAPNAGQPSTTVVTTPTPTTTARLARRLPCAASWDAMLPASRRAAAP